MQTSGPATTESLEKLGPTSSGLPYSRNGESIIVSRTIAHEAEVDGVM